MKFLIIEDDDNKFEWVEKYFKEHELERQKSYHSGMKALEEGQFDGLILDMGLPCWDTEGPYMRNYGLVILANLDRDKKIIPTMIYSGTSFIEMSSYKHFIVEFMPTDSPYKKEQCEAFIKSCNALKTVVEAMQN